MDKELKKIKKEIKEEIETIVTDSICEVDKMKSKKVLHWRVHIPNLFKEIVDCNTKVNGIFRVPLMTVNNILAQIATRAEELNDPKLKLLCCRLTLFEIADPDSKEFNSDVFKILEKEIEEGGR